MLDQAWQHHLASQEDTLDIDLEDSLPLILCHLNGGLSRLLVIYLLSRNLIDPSGARGSKRNTDLVAIGRSRVVHQDVQLSKFRECQIHNGLPILRLCHIHALEGQVGGVLRGDFLPALDVDVCDEDFGAFFTESTGNGCTETGASS